LGIFFPSFEKKGGREGRKGGGRSGCFWWVGRRMTRRRRGGREGGREGCTYMTSMRKTCFTESKHDEREERRERRGRRRRRRIE